MMSVRLPPGVPDLWPALLRTCRLLHREACPVLYRGNSFRFQEPETSDTFRWGTGSDSAAWVEEINLEFWRTANFTWWSEYICKERFAFRANFPHLKRLTITMIGGLSVASTEHLRPECEHFGRSIRGLASVQIIGLNDESMVEVFEPMLENSGKNSGDRRSVQKHVAESPTNVGWKNVTLWWGLTNENPPHHNSEDGSLMPWRRRRLFKLGDGPNFTYSMGESCIPGSPPDDF